MSKIGIIGDADSVLGFKVFGLDSRAETRKKPQINCIVS